MSVSFDDREMANDAWRELKSCPGVTDMTHKTADTVQRFIAVRVQFPNYSKVYTYLAKEKVQPGSHVVVGTTDGLKVVTVVECAETSKTELEKICELSKFQYIRGKVVAA